MPIILAALIVWGSGQSGPRATAFLLIPFVLLTLYQAWKQNSSTAFKGYRTIGTFITMAAVAVAACIAQIPQILWLVPTLAAGYACSKNLQSEKSNQTWIWGIAIGAGALWAAGIWFPRLCYGKEFLIDSQGIISIAATFSGWLHRRGMELVILVAGIEGFRLFYSTTILRSLAGLSLVLVWICGGALIASVSVLGIGVLACFAGMIFGWNHTLRNEGGNNRIRTIAACCLGLGGAVLAAVSGFEDLGVLTNWFDWLYVWQIKTAALVPISTAHTTILPEWSALAYKILIASCLLNATLNLYFAFQKDALHPNQRALYLSRLTGLAGWSFVGGAGILDPILWWALNTLPEGNKSQEWTDKISAPVSGDDPVIDGAYLGTQSYTSNVLPMATKALWIAGAAIYLVAAAVTTGEIATSLRIAGLPPGPLTDKTEESQLKQALPEHPVVSYLALQEKIAPGIQEEGVIKVDALEHLATQAALWPPLAPWGYMLLSDAAWDMMLLSGISDMSRNRNLCVNSALRVLNDEHSSAQLLVRCSERLQYLERTDDSLIALEKAVKMNPYDADLRRRLANRYRQARLENNAFRQFRAALELDPTGGL